MTLTLAHASLPPHLFIYNSSISMSVAPFHDYSSRHLRRLYFTRGISSHTFGSNGDLSTNETWRSLLFFTITIYFGLVVSLDGRFRQAWQTANLGIFVFLISIKPQ